MKLKELSISERKRIDAVIIIVLLICTYLFSLLIYNHKFVKGMFKNENPAKCNYYCVKDDYIYRVKTAEIFDYSVFASVSKTSAEKAYLDENGSICTEGTLIVLFIWPEVFGETKYGIDVMEADSIDMKFQAVIDSNGDLAEEDFVVYDNTMVSEVLYENRDEILDLIEHANLMWKL